MTLKSRLLNEMTWREADEIVRRTSTVILPVGTVEMHGRHMPMGCDGFISEALAVRLADKIDAAVAPTLHYSFTGANSKVPGGASVPFSSSIEFVKEVVKGLINAGFRKVFLISVHYPNRMAFGVVAREIFELTKVPVVNIHLDILFDPDTLREVLGSDDDALAEATLLAGALRILGREHLIDTASWPDEQLVPPGPESLIRLTRIGSVGFYYPSERAHQPSRAGVEAAKGVEIIERAADKLAPAAGDLDDYIKYLEDNPPETRDWRE
ncbi:MAG: creatininase family protein [Planctomycetota bacterium]